MILKSRPAMICFQLSPKDEEFDIVLFDPSVAETIFHLVLLIESQFAGVTNRPNQLEARIAVALNEKPKMRNCGLNLEGLAATAIAEPVGEAFSGSIRRVAGRPGHDAVVACERLVAAPSLSAARPRRKPPSGNR
jgi:hypothetical protein